MRNSMLQYGHIVIHVVIGICYDLLTILTLNDIQKGFVRENLQKSTCVK